METVCAFLNSNRGGTVLIGVKDDGTILGQDVNDRNLQDLAVEIKRIEPSTKIDVQYISLDTEKKIIVISVDSGLRAPYTYDGRSFIRIQSTTSRMTHEQYEYLYHKNNPNRWENLTNNSCKINDLDKTRIKDVVRLGIAHKRIPSDALKLSVTDILKKLKLIVDDKLTNAAVILFCKKEEKQFMQSNLKLARFNGIDKTSFYDQKYFVANAFDLCDKAMDFLHFHLPVAAHIEPGKLERVETPAIPYNVLREAVTNALVHRDYSHAGGSMSIARYDDRVAITNFGSLPEGVSLNKLGKEHESVLRNPLIANVFFICGSIEKWGRGTIDMIKDSKNVGNPLPIYEEIGNSFSVTLPLREATPSIIFEKQEHRLISKLTDRQYKILEILKSEPLSRQQIEEKIKEKFTGRTLQRELTNLKNMGLVEIIGKAKDATWTLIAP
jgi:ATP-dependent DNA helicase RecG